MILMLPRQTTPYTCGAACLAAIARLCGLKWKESEIAQAYCAKPETGIANDTLETWARKHLPVATEKGFPSIWNIRNPLSGNGHYVLALGERDGRVRYYDPLYARVLEYDISEIDWQSGCGNFQQWRLDFKVDGPLFEIPFVSEPHEGIPAGEPIPEFVLNSLRKYLDRNSPRYERMCPLGGQCSCSDKDRCESR